MSDLVDKARDEFLSETQEIIDRLSRDLLLLDATSRVGPPDPDLINAVFRGVHTLKGLAGMFNATRLSAMSHELENVLDDLRMGRVPLTAELLDLLFRSVELYNRVLAADKAQRPEEADGEYEAFMRAVRSVRAGRDGAERNSQPYDLDPGILAVLTQYEEHRLRACVDAGLNLYRVRVSFLLTTIDDGLESLKNSLKPLGEILTYLPTGEATEPDAIELEILLASGADIDQVGEALQHLRATLEEVPRRRVTTGAPASPLTPVPASMQPQSVEPAPPTTPPVRTSLMPGPAESLAAQPAARARRGEVSLRSVAQTVRVDIERLDHLMNLLGELAIVRGGLARIVDRARLDPINRELARELGRLQHAFERHLGAMQTGVLEVRMVPLGQVFEKLARVARQASREAHKEVNLVITGAETEVDKLIGEELSDPLMHMVRNALDHGIEAKEVREQVGKPPVGTIALNAYQKGNQVVVEVEDDGAGIDRQALIERALRREVITSEEAAVLTPQEALQLIFVPGISTREAAGKLSGRGVGMDVVKTNIGRLGGVVDVHSEVGIGTKLTITLPITLAIIAALMVRVGESVYAIPLSSVQEAVMLDGASVRTIEGREIVTMRGESLPICRLTELFQLPEPRDPSRRLLVVVAAAAARRCGFVVDHILGRQDIVIKPLSGPLRGVSGFAGATELGDQRIGLVIDVPSLLEEALASSSLSRTIGAAHG